MVRLQIVFISILSSAFICDAYKILVVFPLPGKSHSILGEGVVRHLLNAGHEVTYITAFLMENTHPNLHQVDVTNNTKLFPHTLTIESIISKEIQINDVRFITQVTTMTNVNTLGNENVQNMLNDRQKMFDCVVVEWMFSELLSGLAAVYDVPLIWISSVEPHWQILQLIDEIPNPAYNSDIMSERAPPLNFWERVDELWTILKILFYKYYYVYDLDNQQYEKLLGPAIQSRRGKIPPFEEVKFSGALVLGNSHVSMGQATRLPQNYKSIGGYHIETKVKPLPEDLKKIMDGAKDGVIYFSMGSNLKSSEMPEQMKSSLLKMFGELKQTVMWKFEEDLPNKPSNVHILKWAPQPSILAHQNCILFITHGGLLSTTETIHFGVPIIGIPAFADQFINVMRSVRKGFAVKVDLSYSIADDLKVAIQEVLQNKKYSETVKELSEIYHDRPLSPGDELVYWVQHVIRTKGAQHLKSPALSVPFYQKMFLDLLAIILFVIIIVLLLVRRVVSLLFSKKVINEIKKNK